MFAPWMRQALLAQSQTRTTTLEEKVHFMMAYERKKCSSLLFFGATFGFLGFAFAFLIGFYKFINPHISEFHEEFPSGNGYFPATVSEMVHDPRDPAGKCFFAFEFIGAFFIFMSWYPWELRNVYVGDSDTVPCLSQLSWSMWRQFVPPSGMMLVATVTTTPLQQANELDYVCICIHLAGAVMLFVGYGVVEAFSLGWGPIKQSATTVKTIGARERMVRKLCLDGLIAWYCFFAVCTVAAVLPLENFGGKNDVWERRIVTTDEGAHYPKMVLVDTASGWVLGLKIASYVSEVACGLCLISSFLAIWYYCEERHSDLKDELFSVADEMATPSHANPPPSTSASPAVHG